MNSFKNN